MTMTYIGGGGGETVFEGDGMDLILLGNREGM